MEGLRENREVGRLEKERTSPWNSESEGSPPPKARQPGLETAGGADLRAPPSISGRCWNSKFDIGDGDWGTKCKL